jgi:hypothetical protein
MSSLSADSHTQGQSIDSLLTEHGRKPFQPAKSEFVLHTSTIPLATTMDMQYLRKITGVSVSSKFHGATLDRTTCHCPKRSCMYLKHDRTRTNEHVPHNCPCLGVRKLDGSELEPICFLAYLKSLNRNLVDVIDEDAYTIDPSSIMFCQDAQGIFDNKYPGAARDFTKCSGFGHLSEENVFRVLDSLYWFRKYKKAYNLHKLVAHQLDEIGLLSVKRALKQSMHTLNGLLVKKFIVFGPEIVDYMRLAQQTARLFRDLFTEYCMLGDGAQLPSHMCGSAYGECKDLFNNCKEFFYKGGTDSRSRWLYWSFTNKALAGFWVTEFRRLQRYISMKSSGSGAEYTTSLAWIFRSATFAQTRNLGYLPPQASEVKFRAFREIVTRPLENISKEQDRLIRMSVRQRFISGGVKFRFLQEPEESEEKLLADKILGNISLGLKGSASVDHSVLEGGKLEDARLCIRRIIDNDWMVPIRSLDNNEIVDHIVPDKEEFTDDWNRILFWFSYQLVLNWLAERDLVASRFYYSFTLKNGSDYTMDVLRCSIVHIMEPGKVRNLVKGTGEIAWFLTPGAKILQATLALLPEHRAGLELSAHDWVHTRRVSAESDESGFIYDHVTGYRRPSILQVFKDWTESTDFISKRVGVAHLGSMMDYIGFPQAYGETILKMIRLPQPVEELLYHRTEIDVGSGENILSERRAWSGQVSEGFMMGMPITKVILHLIHSSEREVALVYLARRGIVVSDGRAGPRIRNHRVEIPRDPPSNSAKTLR